MNPQVRSFFCIASVSPSVQERRKDPTSSARHFRSSGHCRLTHAPRVFSASCREAGSTLEARRAGLLSRKHLLHRDPAIMRTLTGQIPRGVSANVHMATGLRWWPRRSVNSKPHLPLALNYVKKRLKTVNKRALTSSHDVGRPIQQRESEKSSSRGQGGLRFCHCHMTKQRRGKGRGTFRRHVTSSQRLRPHHVTRTHLLLFSSLPLS